MTNGKHRLRVIAGMDEAVIRHRVIFMSDNPEFCSVNAINKGVTLEELKNGTLQATFEFRPIGKDVGFFCSRDGGSEFSECASFSFYVFRLVFF